MLSGSTHHRLSLSHLFFGGHVDDHKVKDILSDKSQYLLFKGQRPIAS